jgi:hypothetical protein
LLRRIDSSNRRSKVITAASAIHTTRAPSPPLAAATVWTSRVRPGEAPPDDPLGAPAPSSFDSCTPATSPSPRLRPESPPSRSRPLSTNCRASANSTAGRSEGTLSLEVNESLWDPIWDPTVPIPVEPPPPPQPPDRRAARSCRTARRSVDRTWARPTPSS